MALLEQQLARTEAERKRLHGENQRLSSKAHELEDALAQSTNQSPSADDKLRNELADALEELAQLRKDYGELMTDRDKTLEESRAIIEGQAAELKSQMHQLDLQQVGSFKQSEQVINLAVS